MNKIFLIIKREYITRVRKRSFIVMTILGPILMAALFIVPAYLALKQEEKRVITVVDETGRFAGGTSASASIHQSTNDVTSARLLPN